MPFLNNCHKRKKLAKMPYKIGVLTSFKSGATGGNRTRDPHLTKTKTQ